MGRFFIRNGNYFETVTDVETPAGAVEVPQRPSAYHVWDQALNDNAGDWAQGPMPEISVGQVNDERDRRLRLGATVNVVGYGNVEAQLRPGEEDGVNLLGQVAQAQILIGLTDLVTTLRWRDGNNIEHQLTAPQMIDFAQKAAAWKEDIYAHSWTIREMDPIPQDYADDSRWP